MINPLTHRKILKKGRPGRARITAMQTPERNAGSQNLRLTLEVYVEGLSPYEVEGQWMVSRKDTLGFGIEVPVKVDADKPDRVAIDWEAARVERANEKQTRREQLAAQPPVGAAAGVGGQQVVDARNDPELRAKLEQVVGHSLEPGTEQSIDVSGDPAMAARIMQVVQEHTAAKGQTGAATGATGAAADPLEKLERLAKLRESGALSEAEFEQEKRELLGEI